VFEGRVGLRAEVDTDGSDLVDDWLAATELPNAGRLPRRIDLEEAKRPLTFVLRVPDAAAFVRDAVVDSPRMRAEVLDDHRVRLRVAPDASDAPAAPLSTRARARALAGGDDLFVDHPRMVRVARRLAPEGTRPEAAAAAIVDWVHRRIRYEVTPRSLTSLEILDTGRGDCTEYAHLTVSLLRAAGIPAEIRDGLAASGDEMVAHAWAAWHDGERWHEIDPTWGEPAVTAGHLELSVTNTLALISLGEIEVVEVITTGAP
jgi:transglutaminase-like putative cysteine protease